ncbi:MAG: zf-HC2 domain-containing protein [bacterium]
MKKNRCSKILEWIGPYADGELSPSRSAMIGEHLKDCLSCRTALERLRQTQELIRQGFAFSTVEEKSDLEALHSRVKHGIRLQEAESKEPWWSGDLGSLLFRWARILVPSAVAAALVAGIFFKVYNPPLSVIKTAGKNECIIDSIEGANSTVLLFKTHDSDMTVIWLSVDIEPYKDASNSWIPYSA